MEKFKWVIVGCIVLITNFVYGAPPSSLNLPAGKVCDIRSIESAKFDEAKGGVESTVRLTNGKTVPIDGFSLQCMGKAAARSVSTFTRAELMTAAQDGCTFTFDAGNCLCESRNPKSDLSCRATNLKALTEALEDSRMGASSKASR